MSSTPRDRNNAVEVWFRKSARFGIAVWRIMVGWDAFCVATPGVWYWYADSESLVLSHGHSISVTKARPSHPLPTNVI